MTEATVSEYIVEKQNAFASLKDLCLRLVKQKPLGLLGGVIILLTVLTGIFADYLAPYGYNEINVLHSLEGPSFAHILGCDNLGRDLLSRIIYGARISMLVSIIASIMTVAGSAIIGITSGYFGGKYDLWMQRWVDAVQAFPALVLYLTAMVIIGPGLWQVILVLGISGGLGGGRIFRSAVFSLKESMFIDATKAIGASSTRILWRHIIPHVTPLLIISFSLSMGRMILAEASLSFLGFGIPPPFPSWGGMLSGSGREFMIEAPWMIIWPGLALFLVIYSVNMFGDAIRDLLDPSLKGGLGRYGGMKQGKLQNLILKKLKGKDKSKKYLASDNTIT
jgi:peptide/nickel transport system permease protein